MANGAIKGITISFAGDTTKLDKALREINNKTKSLDKELKQVDKALKFNPTSVELWRQKQQLLTQKITETKSKLDALKQAQAQMDASGVDKNSQEYRQLQREIITTESKLKGLNKELREVGNANLKALSAQLKEIGGKITSAGQSMTTKFTAPIVAGYTLAANYASDYEENLNKIDVAFGDSSQVVKDWANTASASFGLSKVQATSAASAFGALGKGIGLSEKDAADMSVTLAGLSADLGSYFNVSTAESSKALEGIFTGESEALKKFGVVMTDTNLKQFAADQGLVWNEMSQTEKTMLRYQYVLAQTKDAQGDFARTSDGTANSTKMFQASLQDLGTSIGTNLLPIITPVIQKITEWINKFQELSPHTQKVITIIGLVVAAIGPVLVVIGTLISSIGAIVGALGMVTAPMLGIIAIIAAVILFGIKLYQNWDLIKAKAAEIWNSIKTTISTVWDGIKSTIQQAIATVVSTVVGRFQMIKNTVTTIWNGIKTAITTPINAAVTAVRNAIDKIKSIVNGAHLSLPHFKLPHFKLSGKFSLKDMTVPHLSVSWYKTGGIFDNPSVIGVGEAGPEAVVPLDKFWDRLDNLRGETNIVINVNGANRDPKEIAEEIKRMLIRETNQRRLAWQ